MNPFLQPAVASPLPRAIWRAAAASPRWRRAAGTLALAAGIGLGIGAQPAAAAGVDLNLATAAELESVRGIGPKTAETIVRERERSGPFTSFQDFAERIRGIGPKRAESLRAAGLVVSEAKPAKPTAAR